MRKILFICLGNICRSAAAEYVMRDILRRNGLEDKYIVASAGTSAEESGNGMYPPMFRELAEHGVYCDGHVARKMKKSDYEDYDYLIGMDRGNLYSMRRMWPDDPDDKMHLLMDYTDDPREVSDPWYTRDFAKAYSDIVEGCEALFDSLTDDYDGMEEKVVLDLRNVRDRNAFHELIRHKLPVPVHYGNNLDALYDVLTAHPDTWVVEVLYSDMTEKRLGHYFKRFCRMCRTVMSYPETRISFTKM